MMAAGLAYRLQPALPEGGEPSSIIGSGPVSTATAPCAGLDRLAHEYELKDELDGAWAARPLAFVSEGGRTALLLDDPGGEPLDRLLGAPWRWTPLAPCLELANIEC